MLDPEDWSPMSEKTAYDCGALYCCGGEEYPDCQADMGATISVESDGALHITPIRRGEEKRTLREELEALNT